MRFWVLFPVFSFLPSCLFLTNATDITPRCGDGIVDLPLEDCDGGAGCGVDCKAICGDGVVISPAEECDDGDALDPTGACSSICSDCTDFTFLEGEFCLQPEISFASVIQAPKEITAGFLNEFEAEKKIVLSSDSCCGEIGAFTVDVEEVSEVEVTDVSNVGVVSSVLFGGFPKTIKNEFKEVGLLFSVLKDVQNDSTSVRTFFSKNDGDNILDAVGIGDLVIGNAADAVIFSIQNVIFKGDAIDDPELIIVNSNASQMSVFSLAVGGANFVINEVDAGFPIGLQATETVAAVLAFDIEQDGTNELLFVNNEQLGDSIVDSFVIVRQLQENFFIDSRDDEIIERIKDVYDSQNSVIRKASVFVENDISHVVVLSEQNIAEIVFDAQGISAGEDFKPRNFRADSDVLVDFSAVDVNNDEIIDVVVATEKEVTIILRNAEGKNEQELKLPLAANQNVKISAILVEDINDDGTTDFTVLDENNNTVSLFLNRNRE